MNSEESIREVRKKYQQHGHVLNELQRRHWAAKEALQLGHGGIAVVSKALRISPNTVKRGIQEISTGQADSQLLAITRIRKPGGGRKSKTTSGDLGLEPESAHTDDKPASAEDPHPEIQGDHSDQSRGQRG